jgi:AcrR family transcriptional regulator
MNVVQLSLGKSGFMARRADHNREELHDLALAAARRIVEEDGFRALTARNVADSIGYSAGTLYNLFDNIDDLVVHVNGGTLDALFAALREAPTTGQAGADVAALSTRYLTFLDQNPNLCELLFEYSYAEAYLLPDWYRQKISLGLEILGAALSPLFPAGSDTEKSEAARTIWASLQGICSLSKNGKLDVIGGQSRGAMTQSLVTNFVAGLSHRKTSK